MANSGFIIVKRHSESTNRVARVRRDETPSSWASQSQDRKMNQVKEFMAGEYKNDMEAKGTPISYDDSLKIMTQAAELHDKKLSK